MGSRDSIARALMNWFGKSRAVDDAGKPALVYRGEHGVLPEGQTFHTRTPGSLSFGSQDAAHTYAMHPNNRVLDSFAQEPRITPGYLKIENPIVHDMTGDPFIDVARLQDALGTREARRIAHKFDDNIRNTNNWEENYYRKFDNVADLLKREPKELRNLYFEAYPYLDDTIEAAKLQRRGFDGAILGGTGDNALETEYRIFDPANFRSKYKLYGGAAAPIGALAAQDVQWPEVPQ